MRGFISYLGKEGCMVNGSHKIEWLNIVVGGKFNIIGQNSCRLN